MESLFYNPVTPILLTLLGFCSGFLLGYFIRARLRREPEAKTGAEIAEEEPAEEKPAGRNWLEIAKLWRDRRDGNLIFQIEDQHYKHGSDLTPKEREILLKVVMDFYRWLEPPSAALPRPEEPAPPQAAEAEPVILIPEEEPRPKSKLMILNPVRVIAQAIKAEMVPTITPAPSMVAQIDAILQEKLNATNMQKWAVRLTELPNRGMVVLVGLEQYDGIEAVPYERVRALIREAVAEWERRAERGELLT